MSKPLWTPSQELKDTSLLTKFLYQKKFSNYQEAHQWSCDNIEDFWKEFWFFSGLIGNFEGEILNQEQHFKDKRLFTNCTLNYAENLLKHTDDKPAIIFYNENLQKQILSGQELYQKVSQFRQYLQDKNVKSGDRIAGYLPNLPETVIAMIATASLGAIWSSCSPDFGVQGAFDRFSQITPKILIACDGYIYNGKRISILDKVEFLKDKISTIEEIVIVPYINDETSHSYYKTSQIFENYVPHPICFERFPFNHPLFIMFSSGTTGAPKCIVHSAGGSLIQHMKEHQLQCNIHPHDKVFYYTTCGWMMWNWLVSALASSACIVLYEGSPTYPSPSILWDMAQELDLTFFGTSAKYLSSLQKINFTHDHELKNLRTIASTGSPLLPETFDYVYTSIKNDVHLTSVSGGTDIISCFLIGNVWEPVWRGELQGAGLGYLIDVFDDEGNSLSLNKMGELVCKKPFPSQPLGFWNDDNQLKFHDAYFNRFENIWHHGDLLQKTDNNGFIIFGRSDAVLNPGGVRIGTAEIYRQVEQIEEVLESMAVGQPWEDSERIILFVKLKDDFILNENLIKKIKEQIRNETTPRHVPAKIIQVKALPYTKNGKLSELTVKHILTGIPVKNKESLINPECLSIFENIKELT